MKIEEFLKEPFLNTPSKRGDGVDYLNHIFELFNTYNETIQMLEPFKYDKGNGLGLAQANLEEIKTQSKALSDCIREATLKYYNGNPSGGYTTLKDGLEAPSTIGMSLSQILLNRSLRIQEGKSFYRIRKGGEGQSFERKDLFHVPMNQREKISTQRFSIPGFPSLYLANSTFLCWEEMGRDELRLYHASRFAVDQVLILLDLRDKRRWHLAMNPDVTEGWNEDLIRYLTLWPLVAATSVVVKERNKPFKPEYIIPQLILQWVRNIPAEKMMIHGIAYSSTRTSNHQLYNAVFPVRSISNSPFCHALTREFSLTSPISWEYLNLTGSENTSWFEKEFEEQRKLGKLEILKGRLDANENTKFGLMERILSLNGPRFPLVQINAEGTDKA